MTEDEEKHRESIIETFATDMSSMTINAIACRAVQLLIFCEGNINRYQHAIEIVLEAHRRAMLRQSAAIIRNNQILHTSEGGVLRPRGEGNIESLAYADELERMAK